MSNAPFGPTGYGTVTKNVCYRLLKVGYNVATLNYWGHSGRVLTLDGLKQYPNAFEMYGQDAAKFGVYDFKPHVFITLFDCWIGRGWLPNVHPRWCVYTPVDHYPLMTPTFNVVRHAYRIIAMCQYAQDQFKQAGLESTLIPHGVESEVFKPLPDKAACKQWVGELSRRDDFVEQHGAATFDEDCFVVGVNAANKGDRKNFHGMMRAFKIFLEQNPDARKDARLYLHTWVRMFPEAYTFLDDAAREIGVLPWVRWTPVVKMWTGLDEAQMNVLYNSFDVFINLAAGEGFGIPLIEAQAAGVPCVASDFTAMTELVQDHGWLVPVKELHYTPLNAMQCSADEWKAAEALGEAYNDTAKREKYGKISRFFASSLYDYEKCILPRWIDFLDEIRGFITEREDIYKVAGENLKSMEAVAA